MSAGVCAENKERKEKKRKEKKRKEKKRKEKTQKPTRLVLMIRVQHHSPLAAWSLSSLPLDFPLMESRILCCCCCCWGVKLQLISVQFLTFSSSPGPHSPSNSGSPSLPLSFSPSLSLPPSLSLGPHTPHHKPARALPGVRAHK